MKGRRMRRTGRWIGVGLLSVLFVAGCKQAAAPQQEPAAAEAGKAEERDLENLDPKSLYEVDLKAPEGIAAGEEGTLTLAIRPKEGAEVKPETPLRAKLEASGVLRVEKDRLSYADNARIEGKGPVFEIPVKAESAGEGEVGVDLDFYICIAELCMKTGEQLKTRLSAL